jgi:hypothetical protein
MPEIHLIHGIDAGPQTPALREVRIEFHPIARD